MTDSKPRHGAAMPADATGFTVIPDLSILRPEYQAQMGRQAGNYAADDLSAGGWVVVFDMRNDGCADGFVCERQRSDGAIASVIWNARQIRGFYPPRRRPSP